MTILDWQQRGLAIGVMRLKGTEDDDTTITRWMQQHESLVARWRSMLVELKRMNTISFTMLSVAVRELLDLSQASLQQVRNSQDKLKVDDFANIIR